MIEIRIKGMEMPVMASRVWTMNCGVLVVRTGMDYMDAVAMVVNGQALQATNGVSEVEIVLELSKVVLVKAREDAE